MSKDTKAPQAFPYSGVGDELNYSKGMTLRDYFASAALTGLIGRVWINKDGGVPTNVHEIWVKSAYAAADAMIKARSA